MDPRPGDGERAGREGHDLSIQRLLVINQYFPPDTCSTGFYVEGVSEGAARAGFAVDIIAGQPSYSTSPQPEAPASERRGGIHVQRVRLGTRTSRRLLWTRMNGYLRFLAGATRRASRLLRERPYSALVTFHNPPGLGWIGALLARRHGVPFVYAVYDLHPDLLLATGLVRLPRPLLSLWRRANRMALERTSAVIVIGNAMKEEVVRQGARADTVHSIPLWALHGVDSDNVSDAHGADLGGPDDLLVLYAGNMASAQPVGDLLDVAERLGDEPVRFVLTGDGPLRDHWERTVAARGLDNVAFLPYQSDPEFASLLRAADVGVVTLRPGLDRFSFPSRIYTFLSAGLPVLALTAPDGDVAALVRDSGCGWATTDVDSASRVLRELAHGRGEADAAGRRARELYREQFVRGAVVERYLEVIAGVSGSALSPDR